MVAVVTVLVIVTLVCVYQYTKMKGLDGIRGDVYQLILKAEHVYNASGQGEQKLKWVVQQARSLLPRWLQVIVSEEMLISIAAEYYENSKSNYPISIEFSRRGIVSSTSKIYSPFLI